MEITTDIRNKENALVERIKAAGKLAVAFSGGVDSTYLLYKAHRVLGDDCIAVTVRSQVLAEDDFNRTVEFCKEIGAKQEIIDFDVFSVDKFAENPPDRCYYCKSYDFEGIKRVASEHGITAVADGSNVDDTGDYRPGMRAMKELGIISLLKESGLATWDMPAAACLASRFVYGERITAEGLKRVELSEKFIRDLGFSGIRVRVHGDLARIEASPDDIALLSYSRTRKEITDELKKLGFRYVTLDMQGYRMGSMNEALEIKKADQ